MNISRNQIAPNALGFSDNDGLIKDRMGEAFADEMTRDRFRLKVQAIFDERVETVTFKEKIKQYASDEIDTKIFKSMNYYFSVVGIPLCISLTTLCCKNFSRRCVGSNFSLVDAAVIPP